MSDVQLWILSMHLRFVNKRPNREEVLHARLQVRSHRGLLTSMLCGTRSPTLGRTRLVDIHQCREATVVA
jgi:hypothetical protein